MNFHGTVVTNHKDPYQKDKWAFLYDSAVQI